MDKARVGVAFPSAWKLTRSVLGVVAERSAPHLVQLISGLLEITKCFIVNYTQ